MTAPPAAPIADVLPAAAAVDPNPDSAALMAEPPDAEPPAAEPSVASKPKAETPAAHQPAPPKPPKVRREGTTAAIIATVVIVVSLSALAVYAYLKTKK